LKEYGFSSANAIVMFTKEKGAEKKIYTGAHNQAELSDWVFAKSLPLVGEITPDNTKRYEKRGVPIVKLFFDVDFGSNIKRTNYYINRLKKAAEGEAQTKLSFAVAKRSLYKDQMTTFGVENKEVSLVIDDFKGSLKYRSEDEVTQESMKKFVTDYLAGKLEPYIKSLPPPEKQEGPVTVVVGKTFNDIVMDPTKDVMIELYAPWCGHCKSLEPIYKQLAEKIQKEGVSNVVIAKMDATVNDSPNANIQAKGYPTIFFVPANKKNAPIQYSGAREVKDMYDFIKKNSASWRKEEL
jgi:protein disulfide isomerase